MCLLRSLSKEALYVYCQHTHHHYVSLWTKTSSAPLHVAFDKTSMAFQEPPECSQMSAPACAAFHLDLIVGVSVRRSPTQSTATPS